MTGFDSKAVGAGNIGDGGAHPDVNAALRAFCQQHGDDLARRAITKQLAKCLLMKGDAMPLDHGDEISLCVAAQRRSAEISIARQKTIRITVKVSEIAAPAARDQYLGSDLVRMVEQQA